MKPPAATARNRSAGTPKTRRIALAFAHDHPQLAAVRRGVFRYARETGAFRFVFNLEMGLSILRELPDWHGDGAIVHLTSAEQVALARKVRIPLVNYGGAIEQIPVPSVRSDYDAEGALAADHLMARGFTNFAYVGGKGLWYARMRMEGFRKRLEASGRACAVFFQVPATGLRDQVNAFSALKAWMEKLPLPVALMVDRDIRTVGIYEASIELGLRIPSDVAMISVDNDPLVTHAYDPSLTSISVRHEEVGYRAMALLHRLMDRDPKVPEKEIVPAGEIVERGSTDTVVVSDPRLRQVIECMQQNLEKPLGIKELLDEMRISRRWLERSFQCHLGVSPGDFLLQMRMFRAKHHLRENSEMDLDEIVRRSGFFSRRHLTEAFQRLEGRKPLEYRSAAREA